MQRVRDLARAFQGAHLARRESLADRGDQHDRDRVESRSTADLPRHLDAGNARHARVEHHGLERLLARRLEQAQRLAAGIDFFRDASPAPQVLAHDRAAGRLVACDQHPEPARRVRPSVQRHARATRPRKREVDPEAAAATLAALDPDRSAHELDELAADREPQPRAAVAPRRRAVGLREAFEDQRLAAGRDADAGVADRDAHADRGRRHVQDLGMDRDLARFGELDRVAHQVGHDLTHASGIAHHRLRDVGRHEAGELDAPLLGACELQVRDLFQRRAQLELHRLDRHLARLDLREVQHVVEHGEQGLGAVLQGEDVVALLDVQRRAEQQAGHAQHAVHRRANLVAHVREELGLGAGGGERLVARPRQLHRLFAQLVRLLLGLGTRRVELGDRPAQLLLGPLALGDVLHRPFVVRHEPVRIAHRAAVLPHPDHGAVTPAHGVLEPFDGPGRLQPPPERVPLFGGDPERAAHVGDARDQLLGRRIAANPGERRVGRDDPPLGRGLERALDRILEDRAILLLRGAPRAFGALALDPDAGEMRRRFHATQLGLVRSVRLPAVHGECSQHLARARQDRLRPARAHAQLARDVAERRPRRIDLDVGGHRALAGIGRDAARPHARSRLDPVRARVGEPGQTRRCADDQAPSLGVEDIDGTQTAGELPLQ